MLQDDPHLASRVPGSWTGSWGSFALFVRGKNLTRSRGDGGYAEAVDWYLTPLFLWFADNWEALLHEGRFPIPPPADSAAMWLDESLALAAERADGPDDRLEARFRWWRRHALRSAHEGAVLPNAVLRRVADDVEVSWSNEEAATDAVPRAFIESRGADLVDAMEVAGALRGATEAVAEELPDRAIAARLRRFVRDARRPSPARIRFYARWLSGLGEPRTAGLWRRFEGVVAAGTRATRPGRGAFVLPQSVPAMLFATAPPSFTVADREALVREVARSRNGGARRPAFRRLAGAEPCSAREPWRSGYELANRVRRELKLRADEKLDPVRVLGALGVSLVEVGLSDNAVRGACIAGADLRPTVLVNASSSFGQRDWARRMTIAHELCHILFDRPPSKPLGIVSGEWAPNPQERRSSAFAAELLMPGEGLSSLLGPPGSKRVTIEGVGSVCDRFGVGIEAAVSHLRNRGWVTWNEYEDLLGEATTI